MSSERDHAAFEPHPPALEAWAEVASFDAPGVGDEELSFELVLDPSRARRDARAGA
jgi:hypothetical protein